jgi:hypothetical protein
MRQETIVKIVREQQSRESVWWHHGLLDMGGRPLLYSPAFYPFYMDLMSQRPEAEFTCGG